jgi:hypothetical protein
MPRISCLLLLLLLAGLLLSGCTATSASMVKNTSRQALVPPRGQALVVFIRPSSSDSSKQFTLLDHNARYLGDSLPRSHHAVPLLPGQHTFICWSENSGALRATLAADRVYYVEVGSQLGSFSPRCNLLAVTPRSPRWSQLPGWLGATDQHAVNLGLGQSFVNSRITAAKEQVRRGREALARYTPAELAERTILPQDGAVVGQPAAPAPAAPAPAAPAPASQPQ